MQPCALPIVQVLILTYVYRYRASCVAGKAFHKTQATTISVAASYIRTGTAT